MPLQPTNGAMGPERFESAKGRSRLSGKALCGRRAAATNGAGMNEAIRIEVVTSVDSEIVDAMGRLVPQLSASAPIPSIDQLQEIVSSPCTVLLVARESTRSGRIVGSLTLALFRIPTGVRAWIEDVVVDSAARGSGVGDALSREALRVAVTRGARTVELTSRSSREAANRLYQRLGFQIRETNVYRYSAGGSGSAG